MILVVEERDYQETLGLGPHVGWSHYFTWPGMDHINSVVHSNNNNHNDSGQSACFGSNQYQVNCICTEGTDNYNLFVVDGAITASGTYTEIEAKEIRYGGDIVRMLGIDFYGNQAIIGGMDHPNYSYEGLWLLPAPWEDEKIFPMATGWIPSGIAIRGNQVWSVCQDDEYLRVHSIQSHTPGNTWLQINSYALPDAGASYFRGCAWFGNILLVGNQTENKVYELDVGLTTVSTRQTHDISAYMHDAANEMPYGLWFWGK